MAVVSPSKQVLSSDSSPLPKYASKVPLPKKCGDTRQDDIRTRHHNALIWTVDRLLKRPHETVPVQSYMLTSDLSLDVRATGQSSSWTGAYSCLGQLPKDFQLRFLLRRGQDLKLQLVTKDLLSNLERADASLVHSLFAFDLQLPFRHFLRTCTMMRCACVFCW